MQLGVLLLSRCVAFLPASARECNSSACCMWRAAGAYAGMDRFDARQQLWKDMEAAGLVIKKEAYTTR